MSRFFKMLIFISLIICFTSINYAKPVKFSVDMTGYELNTTGLHVAGDFQAAAGLEGGDWQSNTATLLREGNSNIYSIIVDIPANAKYEYRFLNGDQWYDSEFVPEESRVGYDFNDNRWIWVDDISDTTFTGAIKYSGNAPEGLKLCRFFVDMSKEKFINESGVFVSGNFANWEMGKIQLYSFADKIYQIIIFVTIGEYDYKFFNGPTENDSEIIPEKCTEKGNRIVAISSDTQIDTVYFGTCLDEYNSISVNQLKSSTNIFPNPSHEYISIITNNQIITKGFFEIYNLTGKLLLQNNFDNHSKVSIKDLSPGVYFIKLYDETKALIGIKKLIKN